MQIGVGSLAQELNASNLMEPGFKFRQCGPESGDLTNF